jgi:hypothetical protein
MASSATTSLRMARPFRTTASAMPLLQFAGDLLSSGILRSRDLFVIGLFYKGLDVIVLLFNIIYVVCVKKN